MRFSISGGSSHVDAPRRCVLLTRSPGPPEPYGPRLRPSRPRGAPPGRGTRAGLDPRLFLPVGWLPGRPRRNFSTSVLFTVSPPHPARLGSPLATWVLVLRGTRALRPPAAESCGPGPEFSPSSRRPEAGPPAARAPPQSPPRADPTPCWGAHPPRPLTPLVLSHPLPLAVPPESVLSLGRGIFILSLRMWRWGRGIRGKERESKENRGNRAKERDEQKRG